MKLQNAGEGILAHGTEALSTSAGSPFPDEPCRAVTIQSRATNNDGVLIGDETTQVRILEPGQGVRIGIDQAVKVYLKSAAGTQTVDWIVWR